MGVMEQVTGGVGVGVGPKDSVSPTSFGPSAAAAVASNSIPQGAAPTVPTGGGNPLAKAPSQSVPNPQPTGGEAPKGSDDVDRFVQEQFGSLSAGDKASLEKKQADDNPDEWAANFFKGQMGEAFPTNEPEAETPLMGKIKNFLGSEVQNFKARFRSSLARTGTEELTGLEKVYGKDNVKVSGNNLWVRPEGSRNFKKFNEDETSSWLHYAAQAFGPLGAQVIENPAGSLAQLPATLAQGGAAAVGAALGFASPIPGGAALGGFGGGVAGSKLAKAYTGAMNEWLGQADPNFHYENKLSSIGDAIQNDYVQGAMGAVGGAMYARSATKAAASAALASKNLTQPEVSAVISAAPKEEALAKWTSALKEFHETVVPQVQTAGTEAGVSAGQEAMGIGEHIENYWGKKIGAIEQEASNLQVAKKSFLQPSEFSKFVNDELPKYGVRFTESGDIDFNKTVLQKSAPENIRSLMDLYQESKDAVGRSAVHGVSDEQPGLAIQHARQIIGKLGDEGEALKVSKPTAARMFFQAKTALNVDRAAHMKELFGGEKSLAAATYRDAMVEYSEKSRGMDVMRSMFSTSEKQDAMAKALSGVGSARSLEGVNAIRSVLGNDSPYWQNIRSEMVGRIISRGSESGEFNPKVINQWLNNVDNKALVNTLFEGKTKDLNTMKLIMAQGGDALQQATGSPTAKAKAIIGAFVHLASEHLPGAKILRPLTALTGGNKMAIDSARTALLEGMSKAVGAEQRNAMLESLNAIDSYTAKSQIVDVMTKSGGKMLGIKKYLPVPQMLQGASQMLQPQPEVTEGTQALPGAVAPPPVNMNQFNRGPQRPIEGGKMAPGGVRG